MACPFSEQDGSVMRSAQNRIFGVGGHRLSTKRLQAKNTDVLPYFGTLA